MWFLVAIMTLIHNGDEKDVYVWSNPYFESSEQCLTYVKENPQDIYLHLKEQFPADKLERLLCVEEDRLRRFMNDAAVPQGDSI